MGRKYLFFTIYVNFNQPHNGSELCFDNAEAQKAYHPPQLPQCFKNDYKDIVIQPIKVKFAVFKSSDWHDEFNIGIKVCYSGGT